MKTIDTKQCIFLLTWNVLCWKIDLYIISLFHFQGFEDTKQTKPLITSHRWTTQFPIHRPQNRPNSHLSIIRAHRGLLPRSNRASVLSPTEEMPEKFPSSVSDCSGPAILVATLVCVLQSAVTRPSPGRLFTDTRPAPEETAVWRPQQVSVGYC